MTIRQLRAAELSRRLHDPCKPPRDAAAPSRGAAAPSQDAVAPLQDAGAPSRNDAAAPDRDAGPPQLLDVREPWEVALGALPGSVAIPMAQVPARLHELDARRPVVCICHHGVRSMQVAIFLRRQGFADVSNLAGGIDAWAREVDPAFPTY